MEYTSICTHSTSHPLTIKLPPSVFCLYIRDAVNEDGDVGGNDGGGHNAKTVQLKEIHFWYDSPYEHVYKEFNSHIHNHITHTGQEVGEMGLESKLCLVNKSRISTYIYLYI